jgi:8-oxo-dGTP pyrophosphatase MutT (NUDIX family)
MHKSNDAGSEHLLPRPAQWLAMRWFLLRRAMLLGVRGVLLDGSDQVLLVRHSYTSGWHFPGGGVEIGETLIDALAKELREETGVSLNAPPALHGLFLNERLGRRDHVAVFVSRDFTRDAGAPLSREIAEARFFAIDALPADASQGTRARLREIIDGAAPAARW